VGRRAPVALITIALLAVNVAGARYYLAPLGERARHPWHEWLRPSGYLGQSTGILAFLIFCFLWLYPLRKKWKALAFTGPIGKWLDVHVTTALALPLLLTIHAAWRSDGVIGLGFLSMLVVCASGVVGRYLYTRIPRAKSGVELTREEVAGQRRELIDQIAHTTRLPLDTIEKTLEVATPEQPATGLLSLLGRLLVSDVTRWRRTREIGRRWRTMPGSDHPTAKRAVRNALRLASREIALAQQSQMLDATHRLFRWWHVAHRPFAMTALIAVVIHIVVVVAVGATWFY
jgi:hypothetical protein